MRASLTTDDYVIGTHFKGISTTESERGLVQVELTEAASEPDANAINTNIIAFPTANNSSLIRQNLTARSKTTDKRKSPVILIENNQMLNCYGVAEYFLAHISEDEGDLISNLKLQKLLYYAQGFHLALYDTALFPERIEAWMHGPVVPDLYHEYKKYGGGALPLPKGVDFSIYNEQTRDLLDEVSSVFGQFSAWKLANMTHDEPPWKEAAPNKSEITHEALTAYFKTQLISG